MGYIYEIIRTITIEVMKRAGSVKVTNGNFLMDHMLNIDKEEQAQITSKN